MDNAKLLQLNVENSKLVLTDLRSLIQSYNVDSCLQEPYSFKGKIAGFPLVTSVYSVGVKPMMATLIHNRKVKALQIQQSGDEKLLCLEVFICKFSFILIKAYFQFSDQTEEHVKKLDSILKHFRRQKIIIVADINAKSILWKSKLTDQSG